MLNRSAILIHAWKLYRASAFARLPFDRTAFGRALSMAWGRAKRDAAAAAERARREAEEAIELASHADEDVASKPLTPMAQAIARLSYLPFHMSAAAAEARIRAAYAARGIYA